mgnify:CR=1 FL=1
MLAEGNYNAQIINAEPKTSKAGNEMIEVKMNIDHDGESTHVWDYAVFHIDWKMDDIKSSIGLSSEDDVTVETLMGKWIQVEIIHEEWNGKEKAKVKKWIGVGEAPLTGNDNNDEENDIDYVV